MKSTNAELEKKIDNIIEDLDSLEITKKPLSKSFDSFLKYAQERMLDDNTINNIKEGMSIEGLINFLNECKRSPEYKKSQFKYDRGMHFRIHEWADIAEEKFSKLLNEEIGMPQQDINIIRKPFYILAARTELVRDYQKVLGEFCFYFLIKYKDTNLSVKKFCNRLRKNKCVDLSAVYDLSINDFIKIMETEVVISSDEIINKRFLEEVFIPFRKKEEEYVDEDEMRQEFDSTVKLDENLCNMNISTGKKFLTRNLIDIDNIYSGIRKKYSSLREYLIEDLGLGSKPFLF